MTVTLVAWCTGAHADGVVIADGSPHAIGRAGVGTVGDDGGGALLVNPAAIARRDAGRIQLGVTLSDDSINWRDGGGDHEEAHDQAASSALPLIAYEGAVGSWIVAAGAMSSAASARTLRAPGELPPDELGNEFDYRYAGLAGGIRRDTLAIGAARRFGDVVAVGLSLAASRVGVSETRRVWAGFAGRDVLEDPAHDIEISIDAADNFVPSAVAGVLVAPPGTRVELAASIGYSANAFVHGNALATGNAPDVVVQPGAPTARMELREPLTLRSGARWLGSHWSFEVDGDLWLLPHDAETATWRIDGLAIQDITGVDAGIGRLRSRASEQTHGAVRGALDVELVAGFLWATAGYAFTTQGTATADLSPTFGQLPGQTAALGLELTAGGFTATFGWARTWWLYRTPAVTTMTLDNPFGTGDASVPLGRYGGSSDQVGIVVDAEL